ncbi:Uncharacterised protein [Serratia liquefaciens]|jgi:hypothetical protein|uniref:hypothetical protein n=1 Tax=Serratia entomophila TaxID=42906 RepID=UPI001F4BF5B1|nr:hypothetical protein [Serratia entomophila]CAI1941948.1 Uncharacterised protein [Serratia quinivorans]CAI2007666.1 Uncharacterised protein [Serratia liquefaciens]BEN96549.1 hypothetical protein SMQC08_51620 [Serratia marcescens]CAI2008817.1 Uncharacterised protein [Serratia liquefaciens]CAI2159758.1 Uncharacterised protein [Serratia quinivorans]
MGSPGLLFVEEIVLLHYIPDQFSMPGVDAVEILKDPQRMTGVWNANKRQAGQVTGLLFPWCFLAYCMVGVSDV